MNNIYHDKCLQLVLAISSALDKMEEKDYEAAEAILREGWREAAGNSGALLR